MPPEPQTQEGGHTWGPHAPWGAGTIEKDVTYRAGRVAGTRPAPKTPPKEERKKNVGRDPSLLPSSHLISWQCPQLAEPGQGAWGTWFANSWPQLCKGELRQNINNSLSTQREDWDRCKIFHTKELQKSKFYKDWVCARTRISLDSYKGNQSQFITVPR